MQDFERFCTKLSTEIKSSPYSRSELAEQLGVKPATVKSWCAGRRSPTVFRLLKLADILRVNPAELFRAPQEQALRSTCVACGRTFRRLVGLRIHLALRAREDEVHQRLHDELELGGVGRLNAQRLDEAVMSPRELRVLKRQNEESGQFRLIGSP